MWFARVILHTVKSTRDVVLFKKVIRFTNLWSCMYIAIPRALRYCQKQLYLNIDTFTEFVLLKQYLSC